MEKNRGTVIAVVAALVVAVISLGVAFAAFSASLTINGNATVQASTWDIHYSTESQGAAPTGQNNDGAVTASTSGTVSNATGTLTATNFTWSASFKSPGDTVSYSFYIVNNGDYNAELTTLPSVVQPTCTYSNPEHASTTIGTCPITYTVSKDANGTAFVQDEQLAAHSSQLVVVKAVLNSNYGGLTGDVFGEDVTVNTTQVTFGYTQSGTAVGN